MNIIIVNTFMWILLLWTYSRDDIYNDDTITGTNKTMTNILIILNIKIYFIKWYYNILHSAKFLRNSSAY